MGRVCSTNGGQKRNAYRVSVGMLEGNRKYKRLKLGGGQAYDRSSV
jgi:hypothetical protein